MTILFGIDHRGLFRHAFRLVERLQFPEVHALLLHSVESFMPDGGFPMGGGQVVGQLFEQLQAQGRSTLLSAKEAADLLEFHPETFLEYGDPARNLVVTADRKAVDLIAIGSEEKYLAEAIFFGSVGKGVVLGAHCHVLVSRHTNRDDRSLTAVFATDHSPYANKCADAFLKVAPKGIGKVIVFSSIDHEPLAISSILMEVPEGALAESEHFGERIATMNEELAERFRMHFPEVVSEVRTGHPNETIRQVAEAHAANLVVMGAQGHSWWDRLTIGSRSLHQVMHEAYSVLILRAAKDA